jgi:rare lipoprotein A (peptidoglycan hydrolase)
MLVPLLLLATPQRATLHDTGHHAGASPGRGVEGLTRVATSWTTPVVFAAPVTKTAPPPAAAIGSDTHVVNVSFREVPPTTTTTALSAPGPSAVAVKPATAAAVGTAPKTATARALTAPSSTGLATWYGSPAGTCASPTLAFGTVVTVTDVSTGEALRCTVDDREAHNPGRVIDLSPATFSQLVSLRVGVIEVRLTW